MKNDLVMSVGTKEILISINNQSIFPIPINSFTLLLIAYQLKVNFKQCISFMINWPCKHLFTLILKWPIKISQARIEDAPYLRFLELFRVSQDRADGGESPHLLGVPSFHLNISPPSNPIHSPPSRKIVRALCVYFIYLSILWLFGIC